MSKLPDPTRPTRFVASRRVVVCDVNWTTALNVYID